MVVKTSRRKKFSNEKDCSCCLPDPWNSMSLSCCFQTGTCTTVVCRYLRPLALATQIASSFCSGHKTQLVSHDRRWIRTHIQSVSAARVGIPNGSTRNASCDMRSSSWAVAWYNLHFITQILVPVLPIKGFPLSVRMTRIPFVAKSCL